MPSNKRQREQIMPSHDTKLKRQRSKNYRCVCIGQMIRDVDRYPPIQLLVRDLCQLCAADANHCPSPPLCNRVLYFAVLIPHRRNQRKTPKESRCEKEQRSPDTETHCPLAPRQRIGPWPERSQFHFPASANIARTAPTR